MHLHLLGCPPSSAEGKWLRVVRLSPATYTQHLAPGLAEQLLTVAGILGVGGRHELLKLEQRFPEAKKPNSGLVKLFCCSLWQHFCSCFAISPSGLPSTLPLGGVIFTLATLQLRCCFSRDCHQCNNAVALLIHSASEACFAC